ncbi:MAG: aldo/keto reductase [Nitrospinota bacterium]|nr:aldo/keto reductase [Nitrospinota bacterium]
MEFVKAGQTDQLVSRLGFGGCPMGKHGWGEVSEKNLLEAIDYAIENGVTLFDTADVYGLGESEKLLGAGLKKRRKRAVIATKFGVRFDSKMKAYYDNSEKWMRHSIENSLNNFGTDYIDIYQVHNLDRVTPLADVIGNLLRLKEEGKLRYIGLSNITYQDVEQIVLPKEVVSFQVEYSLANRNNESDIREITKNKKLNLWSWGSLAQGLLSGKYDENSVFDEKDRRNRPEYVNFHGEKLKKNLEIIKKMKEISKITGMQLSQIAVKWIAEYMEKSVVLVGIKRVEQIKSCIDAFREPLNREHVQMLDEISKVYS